MECPDCGNSFSGPIALAQHGPFCLTAWTMRYCKGVKMAPVKCNKCEMVYDQEDGITTCAFVGCGGTVSLRPERPPSDIDTTNYFMVSVRNNQIVIVRQPIWPLSKDMALNLAAYLLALSDADLKEFTEVYRAVCNA